MTYLFLCSEYDSDYDANALCARNIIKELKEQGHTIFVISETLSNENYSRIKDGVTIFYVKSPLLKRLSQQKHPYLYKLFSIMRKSVVSFLYPDVSPIRSRKVYNLANRIIRNTKIDIVFGVYRPFENIKCLLLLKNKYGQDLSCISYHMDILLKPNTKHFFVKKMKTILGTKAFQKELDSLDLVLLPESETNKYNYDNVKYTGFPVYVEPLIDNKAIVYEATADTNSIIVTYIGSFDRYNRNPETVFALFDLLVENGINLKLHLWGNIRDISILNMIGEHEYIEYHGIVNHSLVNSIFSNSDYLLNLSNLNTSEMIPSKIFELFATGKGIINYYFKEEDASLPYFQKYGHCINVFDACTLDYNYRLLKEWILKNNYVQPFDPNLFQTNTPSHLIKLIQEYINDYKN